MKINTMFAALIAAGLLVLAAMTSVHADTAYKIILKSGHEVIVEEYEKTAEGIRASYGGGVVFFPADSVREVRKVEIVPQPRKTAPEEQAPAAPDTPAAPPAAQESYKEWKTRDINKQLADLNEQIGQKESEKRVIETDHRDTVGQINALKEEGRRLAIRNGWEPYYRWQEALTPADRQWLYENEPRVAKLAEQMKQMEDDLKTLYDQRADLERRLKEL